MSLGQHMLKFALKIWSLESEMSKQSLYTLGKEEKTWKGLIIKLHNLISLISLTLWSAD